MRAPILILVEVSGASQSKRLLDLSVTFIPSVLGMTQDTAFEFLEYGMRNLLTSGFCFIRSVLRHTFTIFGEHERVWFGFLLNNIDRQRIAKNI
jgi:hypothetical protein